MVWLELIEGLYSIGGYKTEGEAQKNQFLVISITSFFYIFFRQAVV